MPLPRTRIDPIRTRPLQGRLLEGSLSVICLLGLILGGGIASARDRQARAPEVAAPSVALRADSSGESDGLDVALAADAPPRRPEGGARVDSTQAGLASPEAAEPDAEPDATDADSEADTWSDDADSEADAWSDEEWDDWDDDLDDVPSGYPDPLEPLNRVTLSFNNALDRLVLDPVTRFYRFVLPDFSRAALVRLFDNLNSPSVMVNDALQLEWDDAAVCTSRLLVNTTLGFGGFLDPAVDFGLEPHASDFGQTLTLAGVPAGMYVVLPLLGPVNARDAVGLGVDSFMHPTFYVLGGTDLLIFGGSAGLTSRARHYEEIQALKESSVDVYAALRSGYYQNREAEIWSRREDRRPSEEGR